jgi:ankyrin repeat protein
MATFIERLILAGCDVNLFDDMGYTPLHHAVEGEQIEAVKMLLERGALINANDDATIGETPLSLAVQGPHFAILLMLQSRRECLLWVGQKQRFRPRHNLSYLHDYACHEKKTSSARRVPPC